MTRYTIDKTGMLVLPEGLSVGGSLDLRGSAITALPEGLSVGRDLHLGGSAITALPEGMLLMGKSIADAPVIADLDRQVYAAASKPEALNMSGWHCGTSHCWAGWITTLAGAEGAKLETAIGPMNAATMICARSVPGQLFPNFFGKNEETLIEMKRRAEMPS